MKLLKTLGLRKVDDGMSCEIEAEFSEAKDWDWVDRSGWNITRDGSLLNQGLEFITNSPKKPAELKRDIQTLISDRRFSESYIDTTRTSIHFHVNIQHWTQEQLMTTLVVYYLVEQFLFNFCDESRQGNLYCLSLVEADATISVIENIHKQKFREVNRDFDRVKYSALNIGNIARLGTIEFRHLQGTNNFTTISNWIDLIRCVTEHGFKSPMDAWNMASMDPREFLQTIFGSKLNLVDCPNWSELLEDSLSPVMSIISIEERLKRAEIKQPHNYKFKSELAMDAYEPTEYYHD